MIALGISCLTFTYATGRQPAITNLSLTIQSGEMVGVIGPNNSGKSTLCSAMAGIIPHFHDGRFNGSVQVATHETTEHSISELTRLIGLVMQRPENQLSDMRYTVFDEVAFGLENLGVKEKEIDERVAEVLDLTGLSSLGDRSPYGLSGGQQQKLALASALAISPEILVLDEPTTFLDPLAARQVFDILLELRKQGKTIVLAEQRLEWLAEFADRIIVLADGKLALSGTPAEVLSDPIIKEVGLDWLAYTQVAKMAKVKGLWPQKRPLPVTLAETVVGFGGFQEGKVCG